MPIRSTHNLTLGDLYRDKQGNIYRLISWCNNPTVCLENIETKERLDFGIGGLTARNMDKLVIDEKD